MRAILFHCRNYAATIGELSSRPKGIQPEPIKEQSQVSSDCIAVLMTVENGDDAERITKRLAPEILEMCQETNHSKVVLLPFGHLSNNLASSQTTIRFLDVLETKLHGVVDVQRGHFGSHKSLLLDIYGHPGNVRYREF